MWTSCCSYKPGHAQVVRGVAGNISVRGRYADPCCYVLWLLLYAQVLLVKFNKARQAKITQEISEIVSGANATG